uniref:Uncharacterized protein n=1 Tax=Vitis vinifera TaxID=29760 RepID=F6I4Q6_VITVI
MEHCQREGPVEIMRHVSFDYFSWKTSLLDHVEGVHFIRIKFNGGDVVHWEITINLFLEYWPVEEVLSFEKMALNCGELRKKDRSDLGSLVLPELNRLKDLRLDHENSLGHSLQGREGTGSAKAKEDSATILGNLCNHSEDIRACVESANVVPALLWLLKNGSSNVKEIAAKTLNHLIHKSDITTISQFTALLTNDLLESKVYVLDALKSISLNMLPSSLNIYYMCIYKHGFGILFHDDSGGSGKNLWLTVCFMEGEVIET